MGCHCDGKKCEKCEHQKKHVSGAQKWKYTLITTVIFLVVVHPMTYKLVDLLVGGLLFKVATKSDALLWPVYYYTLLCLL